MPASVPLATYRVQLTARFGFDQAAEEVPYLRALGISHLYASPILKARVGSNHGYDVVDYGSLNPELGGDVAFERLCEALDQAGIGLILDFVPNHMAVHYADNAWWLDVLEWGPASPYAAAFDIDWSYFPGAPLVLLPILGSPYGEALDKGEIELRYDAAEGSFSAWYYEHRLPIASALYGEILRTMVVQTGAGETPAGYRLLDLAARSQGADYAGSEHAQAVKAELAATAGANDIISAGIKAYHPKSGGAAAVVALHGLLERQHYRPAHWRLASSEINYRRFFDITTLAGLCVEHQSTFAAVHALVARLIARGRLQGLRVDHIDGLHDPQHYFRRLARLIATNHSPRGGDFYVVVEKILAENERLPRFEGVAGTTGYEWLNVLSRVLADDRGLDLLEQTWREASGERRSFDAILIEAKRDVIANMLGSEFAALLRLLTSIAGAHYATRDYVGARLSTALEAFVLHFPVYRTYVTSFAVTSEDRATIAGAIAKARAGWIGADGGIFDFLSDALTGELARRPGHDGTLVFRFVSKAQQFTGPLMAKSLEDTAFYRYHRLLAFNEVGGDPPAGALSVADFHARMQARAAETPTGLTATATHDTKRGEDARTRLLALSELAEEWDRNIQEWRRLNAGLISGAGSARVPSAAHEYMLYQALLGAWPLDGLDQTFVDRIIDYARKAAREGKQQTSWLAPDDRYELGLEQFLVRLLDRHHSGSFIDAFGAFARRAALIGAVKSLTQVTLKITMPGVPDIYQGTELWDLSFVDPDNRRPVDFQSRARALQSIGEAPDWRALATAWTDGRIKLALTSRLLAMRRQLAEALTDGSYRPVDIVGPDRDEIIAFARMSDRDTVIVACARQFARASDGGRRWPRGEAWSARLCLEEFSDVRDMLTPTAAVAGQQVTISQLFEVVPVAVLRAAPKRT
jgi:(1->4)-alpha-D-glucan 1-alpha-D-glucosylmutase